MKIIFTLTLVFGLSPFLNAKSDAIDSKYRNLERVGNLEVSDIANNNDAEKLRCKQQSVLFEKEQKSVLVVIENSFVSKNAVILSKIMAPKFVSDSFSHFAESEPVANVGDRLQLTRNSKFLSLAGKASLHRDLQAYFKKFKKIEKVEFNPFQLSDVDNNTKARVLTYFNVKGVGTDGHLRQDSGIMQLGMEVSRKTWLINEIRFQKFDTLVNQGEPRYKLAAGPDIKTYLRLEAIRRGGYAIAVGDFNGDSNQDMLVGSYGPMQLLKGDGKGGFVKEENAGLPSLTLVKSAAWADFDNDGDQDLIVVRFVPDNPIESAKGNFGNAPLLDRASQVLVYENSGNGKFKEVTQIFNQKREVMGQAMPLALGDFNNDGLIDVYIGYPGVKDFTTFTQDQKDKYGNRVQGIYINKGNLKFESQSMSQVAQYDYFNPGNMLYPHSALAVDIDQNGTTDLAVVDDRGNISPVYKNNGKADFTEYSAKLGIEFRGYGMGAAAADVNNDGKMDLALSNVTFDVDTQMDNCLKPQNSKKPLALFINTPNAAANAKKFNELDNRDLDFPGQGLGGIEFVDYDQDGRQDLYVTNGLWSGNDKQAADISGIVTRALDWKSDATAFDRILHEEHNHTKSYVMDVLANYKDKKGKYLSMGGFQSNRLYKNLGNNRFIDVAYVEGIDSSFDGYIMAKGDFNNDGIQDIVLRNADPGTAAVHNPPVQIFMGQNTNTNSIMLNLTSKNGNKDAIGTEVKVTVDGMPVQTQQLVANNGCAQSQKALFFALGKKQEAKTIEVKWASGKVEVFYNLKKGIQNLTEDSKTIAGQ